MKNPKAKGSAFERKVAKDLSLWLTAGADARQLIRSVLSGGWSMRGAPVTKSSEERWRQVGDLAPNGPSGEAFRARYAIECKHRKRIVIDHVWSCTSEKEGLKAWWRKLDDECQEVGIAPMLIFRSNGRDVLLATDHTLAPLFQSPLIFAPWKMLIVPFKQLLALPPLLFNTPRD